MRALLPFLVACSDVQTGVGLPDKDTGTPDSGGIDDTQPDDTADTDGDLDDDGFSEADGDCDDTDPRVSPVREEDDEDGKDNDCDGKVDEHFESVDVAYVTEDGVGHIYTIDHIGRLTSDVQTEACVPIFLDHAAAGGWYVNDSLAYVSKVEADGTCTQIADYSEADYPPYGVTVTLDGTLYVVMADRLVTLADDGTETELASWNADEEFYAIGLANDPLTGTIGIFDYFGGFATWSAEAGFEFQLKPNLSAPELSTVSGAHGDDGNWYVPAMDNNTGSYGVLSFDMDAKEWVSQDTWSEAGWTPFMMAVDADDPSRPEFYIAASSSSAYQTIWRVIHGTNTADHLWISEGTDFGTFFGIVANF